MDRKEIQEQRIKSYFIEAAKSMIKGEGVKIVSVRRVADEAGYSYATLYNYFKDLKELIFVCVKDFLEECRDFIVSDSGTSKTGIESIKSKTIAYARYFIQYPGIFDLMFLEKMREVSNNEEIAKSVYTFFDELFDEDWNEIAKSDRLSSEKIKDIQSIHKSTVHSLLLFYLNRKIPSGYKEFMDLLNNSLDFIFNGYLK